MDDRADLCSLAQREEERDGSDADDGRGLRVDRRALVLLLGWVVRVCRSLTRVGRGSEEGGEGQTGRQGRQGQGSTRLDYSGQPASHERWTHTTLHYTTLHKSPHRLPRRMAGRPRQADRQAGWQAGRPLVGSPATTGRSTCNLTFTHRRLFVSSSWSVGGTGTGTGTNGTRSPHTQQVQPSNQSNASHSLPPLPHLTPRHATSRPTRRPPEA